jgi:hypothetical protein
MDIGQNHSPNAAGFLRRVFVKHAFVPSTQRSTRWLNLLALPAAALEKDNTDAGDERFGGDD